MLGIYSEICINLFPDQFRAAFVLDKKSCLTVLCCLLFFLCSHGAEKYFRRGARLNWPLGAVSRESIRAVKKLDSLKVPILLVSETICEDVDIMLDMMHC